MYYQIEKINSKLIWNVILKRMSMQYKLLSLHIPFLFWNAEISLLNYYFFVKIGYLRNI